MLAEMSSHHQTGLAFLIWNVKCQGISQISNLQCHIHPAMTSYPRLLSDRPVAYVHLISNQGLFHSFPLNAKSLQLHMQYAYHSSFGEPWLHVGLSISFQLCEEQIADQQVMDACILLTWSCNQECSTVPCWLQIIDLPWTRRKVGYEKPLVLTYSTRLWCQRWESALKINSYNPTHLPLTTARKRAKRGGAE